MSLNQQINNTKVSPLFTLMALALLFALGSFAEAGAQWTTPDANQNINNTNSGNVGIGTTTPTALLEVKKSQSAGTTVIVDNPFTTSGNSAYSGVFLKQAGANRLLISSINDNHGSITPGTAQFWNFANGPTVFATNNTEQMRITANGNVGIGTSNPGKKLEVLATDGEAVRLYRNASNVGWGVNMKFAFNNSNGTQVDYAGVHGITANTTAGSEAGDFIVSTATSGTLTEKLRVTSAGNVGIGTATPNSQYKLDVAGNINSSGTITGNNIVAKYQDVAEWVPSSEKLSAGTVVVLDATRTNEVIASIRAYDTRVAGVISEQPGIVLGEQAARKVLVATTGRVRVKVDATQAAITVGDLLVTSDIPGVAMKSEPLNVGGVAIHRPGTIIGKALEPLAKGSGEILVLLSLQ